MQNNLTNSDCVLQYVVEYYKVKQKICLKQLSNNTQKAAIQNLKKAKTSSCHFFLKKKKEYIYVILWISSYLNLEYHFKTLYALFHSGEHFTFITTPCICIILSL